MPSININNKSSASMEKFLNILESPQPQQQQQDNFGEEKLRYISSKISICNFFGIPEATYNNFLVPGKSKTFREYYVRLCDKYYILTGGKKKNFISGLLWLVLCVFLVCFWTWSGIFFVFFF